MSKEYKYEDYKWILNIEKKILEYWMNTGMTAKLAKEKHYSNMKDWYIHEDSYGSYVQSCFLMIDTITLAKSMSSRLSKIIKKLGFKDYFWSDYGNENYNNTPVVVIGINRDAIDNENFKMLYTIMKLRGNNDKITVYKDLIKSKGFNNDRIS